MNTISTENLLAQIRAMRVEAQGGNETRAPQANAAGFGNVLKSALDTVNETQKVSSTLREDYAMERNNTDLTSVMVAAQKSDLAFRAATEVRNKLVAAYQEIMNMPV